MAASGVSQAEVPNAYDGVPYEVKTVSMTPTYQPETTVYYDPANAHPRLGEVIIFFLSPGAAGGACGTIEVGGAPCVIPVSGLTKKLAMKRVVGLPGDTIEIHRGRVIRNGRPEPEPPTVPCGDEPGCEFTKAITVPAGHYYVMSDDRQLYQEDSRVFGAIPQQAIVGTVLGS
jgi:signal peptidase I